MHRLNATLWNDRHHSFAKLHLPVLFRPVPNTLMETQSGLHLNAATGTEATPPYSNEVVLRPACDHRIPLMVYAGDSF